MNYTQSQIDNNNQIINTLISQLGGNKFMVMTGSKPQYKQVKTENPCVMFKLVKNKSKANRLKVTYLSGMDLYRMDFIKVFKNEAKTIKFYDSIYGDQLQELFTDTTGLYTRP